VVVLAMVMSRSWMSMVTWVWAWARRWLYSSAKASIRVCSAVRVAGCGRWAQCLPQCLTQCLPQ
jgi:hypothetical protein